AFEAPGVQHDRKIVSIEIVAGEVEVDQSRNLVVQKEHVVGEEVGVNDARGQSSGQCASNRRKDEEMSAARPDCTSSAWSMVASASACQPPIESVFVRARGKSRPASCSSAKAAPTATQ